MSIKKGKLLALAAIIFFVVFVRIRLLNVPLERDEGEYAYMGQLLLEGIPPYEAAYNMKFPGVYIMYGLVMSVFGQSVWGIHLGFLILNCVSVLLVFYLCRRIAGDFAAVVASAAYAVMSLSRGVLGFAAHATHFAVLPAVGGAILLFDGLEKKKTHLVFLSGVLSGLAFMMKQQAFFFVGFGVGYIILHYYSCGHPRIRKELFTGLVLFLAGAALPLTCTVVWLYSTGVLGNFWFWTVQYAVKYVTLVPVSEMPGRFANSFPDVVGGFWPLWVMSAGGLIVALCGRYVKTGRFLVLFVFFSFLTVCPGFYFSRHYFVTLLPAVAILTGLFIDYAGSKAASLSGRPHAKYAIIFVFIAFVSAGIYHERDYLFSFGPEKISRTIFGLNPFPESAEIAKFIEDRSAKSDRIAVFGSEPQIYFYSKRRSATGYIYTYGLMEHHEYALKMQKQMRDEIVSSNPRFIVHVQVKASWLKRDDSETYIFNWFNDYIADHYRLVGVADITSSETVYKWFGDAEKNIIQPKHRYVLVYEKR